MVWGDSGETACVSTATVIEKALNVSFARSEAEMGIPILTSEGFVGQRLIVDDYFTAGETLHAGDVVGIKQEASNPFDPKVYKMVSTMDDWRVIGIVHTPSAKSIGDSVATDGQIVPIVIQGVAKAKSAAAIGVGDSVTPYEHNDSTTVSRVETADASTDLIVGRCLTVTEGAGEELDVLVDISGAGHAPSQS